MAVEYSRLGYNPIAAKALRLGLLGLGLVLALGGRPLWGQTASETEPHSGNKTPTLVRLSFWLPHQQTAQFESVYARELAPLLGRHGLAATEEVSRATPDSLFCRLFRIDAVAQLAAVRLSLEQDPVWQQALQSLAAAWGKEGGVDYRLESYRTPAGKGKTTVAGTGMRQGLWQTFNLQDGLPSPNVVALLQDRRGDLWFGTEAGITRFDGSTFTTFTTADGLVDNFVQSIAEDSQGRLWFGTGAWNQHGSGVSLYDGSTFTTFTTADGLAANSVQCILEDKRGHIWFGTGTWRLGGKGVSRYDGRRFETFDTDDGLPSNTVRAFLQDEEGLLWLATVDWRGPAAGVCTYNGTEFVPLSGAEWPEGMPALSILEDKQGHIWFGTYRGIRRYDGRQVTSFSNDEGLGVGGGARALLEDEEGHLWIGSFGQGVSRYDGAGFLTFGTEDGLGTNGVWSMLEDREGHVWVGTHGGGVSRYLGAQFTHVEVENDFAYASYQDRQGHIWFGTRSGASRYDGRELVTYGVAEGLSGWAVQCIFADSKGALWFGVHNSGLFRYDGQTFTSVGPEEMYVNSIVEDRDGALWFGTNYSEKGVMRYDSQTFSALTTEDGLVENSVWSVLQDSDGYMWFGTEGGVSRYDGEQFQNFTVADGLASNWVVAIFQDRHGRLWFGTSAGLNLYEDGKFIPFADNAGLSPKHVLDIEEDPDGILWFSEYGGGVSRYDGAVLQRMTRRDGLINDGVQQVFRDRDSYYWIATDGGVTRYRPARTPPTVAIEEVIVDRSWGAVDRVRLSSNQGFLRLEFRGASFTTPADGLAYVYRLQGYEEEWRTTRKNQVEYTDLPVGNYTFQVKAVDRDLNYSETPAALAVRVHPPYGLIALWIGSGLAVLGLFFTSRYGLRRRRERDQAREQLVRELENELQTAHELQMGLMSAEPPQLKGLDIAGLCSPATHVGGDFFQYYSQEGKLSICMADVTGHAMEAAVPVMMFSGVLESEMKQGKSLVDLFASLTQTLHKRLDKRTFVCFAMGSLDIDTRILRLANGGCPYPYHFRATTGEVAEVEVEGFPLGVSAEVDYSTVEIPLAAGDRIVFCSDGIIEAWNARQEMFGFERTAVAIQQGCRQNLSASHLLDYLVGQVHAFTGGTPQEDDQTVVILAVET